MKLCKMSLPFTKTRPTGSWKYWVPHVGVKWYTRPPESRQEAGARPPVPGEGRGFASGHLFLSVPRGSPVHSSLL